MNKIIPLDIEAIKEIGVEKWQKDYYWPISDKLYTKVIDKIWDEFDEICRHINPVLNDVLLSDTKFISFIASFIHCHIVKSACEKEGLIIISHQLSKVYLDPDWEALSDIYCIPNNKIKRSELQLKRLLKRTLHNRHLSLFLNIFGLFRRSNTWSLGSFSEIKDVYIKKHNLYCDHHYVELILSGDMPSVNATKINDLVEPIERFLHNLSIYCETLFYFKMPIYEIKRCWLKRLTCMMQIYTFIQKKKSIPKLLLLTEVAKPTHKVIALAVQSKGGKVVGFTHGNNIGNLNRRLQGYNEYSHCNVYICPTEKSKELRQNEFKSNQLCNYRLTQFQSIELNQYKDIFDSSNIQQSVEYVRTVMIIGYPLTTIRYQYSAADYFYFQLDLELRLAKLLKSNGYKVIYKAHPDTVDRVGGIFDNIVDEVLISPFEQTYQSADVLFFGCLTSTTFGYAVNTNKPIYLVDTEGQYWNNGVYDLIKKRCTLIKSNFNQYNRLIFNEDCILKKLKEKQLEPNYEYVQKLMFPIGS